MRAWGAERTAAATPSSDSGSCFITTAVCEVFGLSDDNTFLNECRIFRDKHMGGKEAVVEYYDIAPKIVAAINKTEDRKENFIDILVTWLLPALKAIHKNDYNEAESIYSHMVLSLRNTYLKGEKA